VTISGHALSTVAVSQRVDVINGRSERRDALDQRITLWLGAVGLLPLVVPNGFASPPALHDWLRIVSPTAVVLSGGNDIGEAPERDTTERCLLDHASEMGLPTLGICRGMQMMAVWAGGALKGVDGHVRTRHVLSGEITSEVNSYHNITLAECPPGFIVTARSEDGEIEAMHHDSLPFQGWMWHPEREAEFSIADVHRARELLVSP
jgi:gamma-glutamyl-gamma-aminobutyrate hydrolase PuuD